MNTASTTKLDAVPQELRDLKQWVVWKMPKKEPRHARDPTRLAKSNSPATWSTFDQAVAAVEEGRADGVGFVFAVGGPYIGIDLDDCLDPETGEPHPVAAKIVARFATYTEVSPSGAGLHLILRGKMPPGAGSVKHLDGQKVEIYPDGRYFTMTGNLIGDVTESGT